MSCLRLVSTQSPRFLLSIQTEIIVTDLRFLHSKWTASLTLSFLIPSRGGKSHRSLASKGNGPQSRIPELQMTINMRSWQECKKRIGGCWASVFWSPITWNRTLIIDIDTEDYGSSQTKSTKSRRNARGHRWSLNNYWWAKSSFGTVIIRKYNLIYKDLIEIYFRN